MILDIKFKIFGPHSLLFSNKNNYLNYLFWLLLPLKVSSLNTIIY